MSNFHSEQTVVQGIHFPQAFEYADAAARTGASGFVAGDISKLARQTDNESTWKLTATTPTWMLMHPGTGVWPLAQGGTNAALTAANGGLVYSGASAFALSAVGTAGQALISGGAGAPTWFNPAPGSIIYGGASGALASSPIADITWDNTNKRLGLGTAGPSYAFDFHTSINAAAGVAIAANFAPSITAQANGDVLRGIYIHPTYNANGKTGLIYEDVRVAGAVVFSRGSTLVKDVRIQAIADGQIGFLLGDESDYADFHARNATCGLISLSGSYGRIYVGYSQYGDGYATCSNADYAIQTNGHVFKVSRWSDNVTMFSVADSNGDSYVAGNLNLATGKVYTVNATQVVGAQGATVADASGGTVIDAEARTAINTLLARVRTHGLIAT